MSSVSILQRIVRPRSHLDGEILKTHQSQVVLDLCLRKTSVTGGRGGGGTCDYHDVIVFEKRKAGDFRFLRFEERFKKLHFRDGLVWTVSLTVKIKLIFHISPG